MPKKLRKSRMVSGKGDAQNRPADKSRERKFLSRTRQSIRPSGDKTTSETKVSMSVKTPCCMFVIASQLPHDQGSVQWSTSDGTSRHVELSKSRFILACSVFRTSQARSDFRYASSNRLRLLQSPRDSIPYLKSKSKMSKSLPLKKRFVFQSSRPKEEKITKPCTW